MKNVYSGTSLGYLTVNGIMIMMTQLKHTGALNLPLFFLFTICLAKPASTSCKHGLYHTGGNWPCCMCAAGTFLAEPCVYGKEESSRCIPCKFEPENPDEQFFTPVANNRTHCFKALDNVYCMSFDNTQRIMGSRKRNASCECLDGFYKTANDTRGCLPHSVCPPGSEPTKLGTATSNTICSSCPTGTFSDVASATAFCKPFSSCGPDQTMIEEGNAQRDVFCRVGAVISPGGIVALVAVAFVFFGLILICYCKCFSRNERQCCSPQEQTEEQRITAQPLVQDHRRDSVLATSDKPRHHDVGEEITADQGGTDCSTQKQRSSAPSVQEHQKESVSVICTSDETSPESLPEPSLPDVSEEGLKTIKNISVERKNDDIHVSWEPASALSSYCVIVYQSQVANKLYEGLKSTNFILEKADPIKPYSFEVWGLDQAGKETNRIKSKDIMICTSVGNGVFYDEEHPLRLGYYVYAGLLEAAISREKVAVKISGMTRINRMSNELRILPGLSHQNVVSYRTSGSFGYGNSQLYMVTELCQEVNLHDLIQQKRVLDGKIVLLHIAYGLAYLHKQNIIHGDVKPQNILLSLDWRNIKICDFDCSVQISSEGDIIQTQHSPTGPIGSQGWRSPEHAKGESLTIKSDIYSAGLVFYFVLSGGKQICAHQEVLAEELCNCNDLPGLSSENAQLASELISKMLHKFPTDRPDTHKILVHPFFWDDIKCLSFLCDVYPWCNKHKSDDLVQAGLKSVNENIMQLLSKSNDANWIERLLTSDKHEISLRIKAHDYDQCALELLHFIMDVAHDFKSGNSGDFPSRLKIWEFFIHEFPSLFYLFYDMFHVNYVDWEGRMPNELEMYFVREAKYQPLGQ